MLSSLKKKKKYDSVRLKTTLKSSMMTDFSKVEIRLLVSCVVMMLVRYTSSKLPIYN